LIDVSHYNIFMNSQFSHCKLLSINAAS